MKYRRLFIPNSIVFITILIFNRRDLLTSHIDLFRESVKQTMQIYKFNIIAICVLKNHVHMLIKPEEIKNYPNIIKRIKRNFSMNFNISKIENYFVSDSRKKKGEKSIWQRRYWEHTIRDEEDLYQHIDYIHFNPMKHYNIAPKDWQFSSFHKYVKKGMYNENWCNFKDIHNINELNYE